MTTQMQNITPEQVDKMKILELKALAKKLNMRRISTLNKKDLCAAIKEFISQTADDAPQRTKHTAAENSSEQKSAADAQSLQQNRDRKPQSTQFKRFRDRTQTAYAQNDRTPADKTLSENSSEAEQNRMQHSQTYYKTVQSDRDNQIRQSNYTKTISEDKQQNTDTRTSNVASGILEVLEDGYGFLRTNNYQSGPGDIYVPQTQIRRFKLKTGDHIVANTRMQHEGERFEALIYVKSVNDEGVDASLRRRAFEDLTPIYPRERLRLETSASDYSMRIIDLVAPVGKGQRGIIVAPPKAGKTTLLKSIANSITTNNPEVKLIVLLIDERPEEVTDMQRSINGDVIYSTFDEEPQNHAKVAEIVLERAKRLVEHRHDVVILLDSITRLARAYNLTISPTGRTLSGGLDPGALYKPKRFFGAARNLEEGGSLTILATALIETGSRMDDMIYEEFKGTGNMEVHLDRKLQERRIFPAIDMPKSGTRKEELLLTPEEKDIMWKIRRAFSGQNNTEAIEKILHYIIGSKDNETFIAVANKIFK